MQHPVKSRGALSLTWVGLCSPVLREKAAGCKNILSLVSPLVSSGLLWGHQGTGEEKRGWSCGGFSETHLSASRDGEKMQFLAQRISCYKIIFHLSLGQWWHLGKADFFFFSLSSMRCSLLQTVVTQSPKIYLDLRKNNIRTFKV